MSRTFLKIKIMSLAAEARIIRAEERKWPRERDFLDLQQREEPGVKKRLMTRAGLAGHRRVAVRAEARSALIAYGFLRGLPYRRIEGICHDAPNLSRIADIVCYFHERDPDEKKAEPWEPNEKRAERRRRAVSALTAWMQAETA